ncbi:MULTISPECIES: helix-turn-helix domain-containing protein [Actinomadura]|uniref:helix-turn-helix domain-containing protein n=1 Tax=Actinomadura TaxID=1988 RepID=UPI002601893D|nr:helix-turn-helix transcriptional regulator [Actinomadura geliboluensis]
MNESDGRDEDVPGHPPAAWRRLGQIVRQRRIELGFGSQASLAAEGGPSLSVVNKIETGRGRDYTDRVIIPLEDRLGWRRGSFRAILDGGEPVRLDAATAAAAPAAEHSHDGNYPEEVVGDPFLRFIWDAPESLADDEDKWAAVTGVLLKRRRPVPRPLDEQQGRQRKADNI